MSDTPEVKQIEELLSAEIDGFSSLWPTMRHELAQWVLRDRAEQAANIRSAKRRQWRHRRGYEEKRS